jgi:hypothetical protein
MDAAIANVWITESMLTVLLVDGRILSVPTTWFPRLATATPKQRSNWFLSPGGRGIHWPEVEEELSADGLLQGVAP